MGFDRLEQEKKPAAFQIEFRPSWLGMLQTHMWQAKKNPYCFIQKLPFSMQGQLNEWNTEEKEKKFLSLKQKFKLEIQFGVLDGFLF